MEKFKCRICGHTEWKDNYWHYECKNCSVFFKNIKQFSLYRELHIEYLENYNILEWGDIHYKHENDSGADLRAAIKKPVTLVPYSKAFIPFGIKIQPSHTDMDVKIYPRSGLASKHGITLLNSVGVIDNHYTGEIMGMFINLSNNLFSSYTIMPGERVAQLIVEKRLDVDLIQVEKVKETDRNDGGFGSTGKM